MGTAVRILLLCLSITTLLTVVKCEDPYLFFTWDVTYGTVAPLGTPQQVILINGQFPGPNINSTTNNNIVINIFNKLDEPVLFTWSGIQHRKNSWQDGVAGTNCPIAPGTNYTVRFQVKDQIGSYIYYPSLGMQRAAGGFGGLRVNSRLLIPVPYADPADDLTVIVNDWWTKSHQTQKKILDGGRSIGRPQGVLINGKVGKKGDENEEPLFKVELGKTYKFRICNTGLKTTINFRIQMHKMKLVEMEGSHTVQNEYDSLDVHVSQCYAVLVEMDQNVNDYYIVASSRFQKKEITTTRILSYIGQPDSTIPPEEIPPAPVGWAWSLNQFRSYRWNLTASAARPNPQGSYHYGNINITRTIKLASAPGKINGKLRYGVNGVSFIEPETPIKLAQYFNVADKVFKYNVIKDDPPKDTTQLTEQTHVLNVTFRDFVEVIFENHETAVQSWHLDGYSFFAVAMEAGTWSPEKRKNYNLLDAVSRHTIQVFPKSWAAILLTFDNSGIWNIRSEYWEKRYLGQQLYISSTSDARSLRDEYNLPEDAMLCGIVKGLPKPPPYSA